MEIIIFAVISSLLLGYLLWSSKPRNKRSYHDKRREAPIAAGYLPILGHLHKLGGNQPLAFTLAAMADVHGPIFTIWIGGQRTVVVSSSDLAKECFTTNDRALASRSEDAAAKYMGYNYAMFGQASYGPYWREVRKIATLELLSPRRHEMLKQVRKKEVDLCIQELYMKWVGNHGEPVMVDMSVWIGDLTFNNIVRSIAGKRYFGANVGDEKEGREFREIILKFFRLAGSFIVSDAIPWLEWADVGGYIKEMKANFQGIDRFMSAWLEEHRLKRKLPSTKHSADEDFMDVMLSTMDNFHLPDHDPDTVVKATSMGLILAGADTTSVTLIWALTLLMNNPHVLQKVRLELDNHVGKDRIVDESDIKNLIYLQAVIKETIRLYPPGPLGVPHKSIEDCQIGGFHVPSKTRLIVNIWKIQHDPNIWSDPEMFQPERFLSNYIDRDVKGQHFEFIPFGSGRRMCPGVTFALQTMHLTLARLLHAFELTTPRGCPVDMSLGTGLTMPKETPLEVICNPRLAHHLYHS